MYFNLGGQSIEEQGKTYSLNSLSFFVGNCNLIRAGRQWPTLVIRILTKQLQESLGVLADQCCKLWIPNADLLQDWLKHLWLLLNDLTQLLKLGIVPEKVKVRETSGSRSSLARGTSALLASSGSGSFKQVNILRLGSFPLSPFPRRATTNGRSGSGSGLGRLCGRRCGRLSRPFLCKVFRDTLKKY